MNNNKWQEADPIPFSSAIKCARENGRLPIITDIKPASPRDGDLLGPRKPSDLAYSLAEAGACALSVVTESKNFNGSNEILRQVTNAVSLPVLAKDFFKTPEQVMEASDAGARAMLLVLATTTDSLALQLYQAATDLGLEINVEIHSEQELERALKLSPTIIGINNRDILQLETDAGDVRITERLVPLVPESIITISESSLRSGEDVKRALQAGADAVLVGTAVLQSSDLPACLNDLMNG